METFFEQMFTPLNVTERWTLIQSPPIRRIYENGPQTYWYLCAYPYCNYCTWVYRHTFINKITSIYHIPFCEKKQKKNKLNSRLCWNWRQWRVAKPVGVLRSCPNLADSVQYYLLGSPHWGVANLSLSTTMHDTWSKLS